MKPGKQGIRNIVKGSAIALIIAGGLIGIKLMQFGAMAESAAQQIMPPEPVNAIEVREVTWQPEVNAVGSVMPVQGTEIRAEVDGVVRDIRFDAGTVVQAGEVLVLLDSDVEKAQLRVARAAAELARNNFKRARDLSKKHNISQADYDAARINLQQAEAQVDNINALIDKKTVRAPFTGTLGIRQISIGQLLNKASPIVSLQSLGSVFVDFSMPQQLLGELAVAGRRPLSAEPRAFLPQRLADPMGRRPTRAVRRDRPVDPGPGSLDRAQGSPRPRSDGCAGDRAHAARDRALRGGDGAGALRTDGQPLLGRAAPAEGRRHAGRGRSALAGRRGRIGADAPAGLGLCADPLGLGTCPTGVVRAQAQARHGGRRGWRRGALPRWVVGRIPTRPHRVRQARHPDLCRPGRLPGGRSGA